MGCNYMKTFFKKIALFLFILLLSCCTLAIFHFFFVGSLYTEAYTTAIVDKIDRLKNIDEPKIILVGNSNVAFGFDSAQIEEALSMPVVNLGLHGALGNPFHENAAKKHINEGDIVVLCHSHFSNEQLQDGPLAWITIDNHPEILSLFPLSDYPELLRGYLEYYRKSLFLRITQRDKQAVSAPYARSAFNEYGDIVSKPESQRLDTETIFSTSLSEVPSIDSTCIDRLNQYNQYVTERGATLVIAGYPIADGKYSTYSKNDFIDLKASLQSSLSFEIISDYTDYFYPYAYFYDTIYHLTPEGTSIRTAQLIADLRAWDPSRFPAN